MKAFAVLLVLVGVFCVLGSLLLKRRLRMEKKGDTLLKDTAREMSEKYNVPEHMTGVTPETVSRFLRTGAILIVCGWTIYKLASIYL